MRKLREKRKERKAAKKEEIEDTSDGKLFIRIISYFVDLILTEIEQIPIYSKYEAEIQKLA